MPKFKLLALYTIGKYMDFYLLSGLAALLLIVLLYFLFRKSIAVSNAVLLERLRQTEILLRQTEEKNNILNQENLSLREEFARIKVQKEDEAKYFEEKVLFLEQAKSELLKNFEIISAKALSRNNSNFLELAKTKLEGFQKQAQGELSLRTKEIDAVVKPLHQSLKLVDNRILELEKTRAESIGGLNEQLKALGESQLRLQKETHNLVKALRTPHVRGRWGEIQLRRVVEIAGMLKYCDFEEQPALPGTSQLRPDMLINLPNQKRIVVDSKAPLHAYLEALEAPNEKTKGELLQQHAKHVRTHLSQLSAKSYWEQINPTPEFVVMFLPGETFFSAALEHDPTLIEKGVNSRVILASPTTLIALLRAVAYGWKQEEINENAQVISQLGKSLYQRLSTLSNHFLELKRGLDISVDSYNKAVGSFENRVLTEARKFTELGVTIKNDKQITHLDPIDSSPRQLKRENS